MPEDKGMKSYVNGNGREVLRITQIIRVLGNEQIAIWANLMGFRGIRYREELDRTASIGNMVHGVLQEYMTKDVLAVIDYDAYGVTDYKSRVEAANAIRSFFGWYERNRDKYRVKFTERTIVGERYGGTIDCGIAGFDDPKRVILVDYKTSSDFHLSQFLQLAGYVKLYEEVVGTDAIEGVMVILTDKKHGEPAKTKFISRENMEPFLICFDCLYNTAVATSVLNRGWKKLGKAVK